MTVRLRVAKSVSDLYAAVDASALICHLTHQAIHAARRVGLREAQRLIQEWTLNLVVRHTENAQKRAADATFADTPPLRSISRLTLALIKSGILRPDDLSDDARTHLHSVYAALEPERLINGLYPNMTSWKDLSTRVATDLPLSKASVGSYPVYLLNAEQVIVVLYTHAAEQMSPPLPFPPPRSSGLRKRVTGLCKGGVSGRRSPRVVFAKLNTAEAAFFECQLLEEENAAGASFSQFVQALESDANDELELQS